MIIKIEVFGPAAFLKSGKLKKRATPECGYMFVGVEPYTKGAHESFIAETAQKLRADYEAFESPYFFTHIIARNKASGDVVRIFESVDDLITSPVKLRDCLGVR